MIFEIQFKLKAIIVPNFTTVHTTIFNNTQIQLKQLVENFEYELSYKWLFITFVFILNKINGLMLFKNVLKIHTDF